MVHKMNSHDNGTGMKQVFTAVYRNRFFIPFCIVLFAILVYSQSLFNGFVWDDDVVIVKNNFISSVRNIPMVLSRDYLSPFVKKGCCFFVDTSHGSGETSYRPMVTLSYFFDYALWKRTPFGYHATNLFLHAVNAVLVFYVILLLTRSKAVSMAAALAWLAHPIQSEAVNVISFREDPLMFFFYLSSFLFFVHRRDSGGRKREISYYILSIICFLGALFTKEMAVSLPGMLFLYIYFFERMKGERVNFFRPLVWFAAALSVYVAVRFIVFINTGEPPVSYPGGSFFTNVLTMTRVSVEYVKWLVFPWNIPAVMPGQEYAGVSSLWDFHFIFSAVFLVGAAFVIYRLSVGRKIRLFAAGWFVITLIPVSNIIPLSNYIAPRYIYLPLLGIAVWMADFFLEYRAVYITGSCRRFSAVLFFLLIFWYGVNSFFSVFTWRNNGILFLTAAERFPDNPFVHLELGNTFRDAGNPEEALKEYCRALVLNPRLVDAYNNAGVVLGTLGKYRASKSFLSKAIRVDPYFSSSYTNLGVTYARSGDQDKARAAWEAALAVNPEDNDAKINLKKLLR
ncbi:MAG: tetratricopeptide repeat protein [Candidatus Omnitrophica bacterium]|nr:tetratricopeptide repeat protein [Candidatus Omnitrophota bacterium]